MIGLGTIVITLINAESLEADKLAKESSGSRVLTSFLTEINNKSATVPQSERDAKMAKYAIRFHGYYRPSESYIKPCQKFLPRRNLNPLISQSQAKDLNLSVSMTL